MLAKANTGVRAALHAGAVCPMVGADAEMANVTHGVSDMGPTDSESDFDEDSNLDPVSNPATNQDPTAGNNEELNRRDRKGRGTKAIPEIEVERFHALIDGEDPHDLHAALEDSDLSLYSLTSTDPAEREMGTAGEESTAGMDTDDDFTSDGTFTGGTEPSSEDIDAAEDADTDPIAYGVTPEILEQFARMMIG